MHGRLEIRMGLENVTTKIFPLFVNIAMRHGMWHCHRELGWHQLEDLASSQLTSTASLAYK